MAISETKLDESFPEGRLTLPPNASPFRLHCDSNGGGIMAFVTEDIPVKLISAEADPTESILFELNFHNKKYFAKYYYYYYYFFI